ncbi:hypothetical protein K435DRAFT_803189 [Dendrothele bispora CBS 962.96]|uniref:Uncharacterized protein n=1 Tax=Dendrothele bispora (strain CBS 962.96) TaxID=1314807 RepID=A0A4S8LI99_DENBC|nr:hypothetical protein K435DRAFT_803189 [Dendrothele bispora CBS 962.96]
MDPSNPTSFFYRAQHLVFRGSTINNIGGDFHQNISVSEHEEFFTVSNLQQLRPFDRSREGYYTAVLYNRALNSLPVVIRRFNRKEDRDRLMILLERFGWTPFVMKKFWALTINGDPCLVVDSAPVYTWQEAVQGNLIEDTQYLQTYHAWTNLQKRSWIRYGDKEDMGVQTLQLFSIEGSIVLDPEKLELDNQIRPKKDIVHQELRMVMSDQWGTVWVDELMRSTVYRMEKKIGPFNGWMWDLSVFKGLLKGLDQDKNLYQDDEDRFEDFSDPSDDDTDNEELATDFDMDVDSPIIPPKPAHLQTAVPFLLTESDDAMDVDD